MTESAWPSLGSRPLCQNHRVEDDTIKGVIAGCERRWDREAAERKCLESERGNLIKAQAAELERLAAEQGVARAAGRTVEPQDGEPRFGHGWDEHEAERKLGSKHMTALSELSLRSHHQMSRSLQANTRAVRRATELFARRHGLTPPPASR